MQCWITRTLGQSITFGMMGMGLGELFVIINNLFESCLLFYVFNSIASISCKYSHRYYDDDDNIVILTYFIG